MFTDRDRRAGAARQDGGQAHGRADLLVRGHARDRARAATAPSTACRSRRSTTPDEAQAFVDARHRRGLGLHQDRLRRRARATGMHDPDARRGDARRPSSRPRTRAASSRWCTSAISRAAREAHRGRRRRTGPPVRRREPRRRLRSSRLAKHSAFVIPTLSVIESVTGRDGGAPLVDDVRSRRRSSLPSSAADAEADVSAARRRPPASYDAAIAAVRQLEAAGVPILAGTDAPNPGTAHGATHASRARAARRRPG